MAVVLVEENLEMPELIVLPVTKLRDGKVSAVVALAVQAAVIRLLTMTLVADKMASVAVKASAVVVVIRRNQHVVLGVEAAGDFQGGADSDRGVALARKTAMTTRKAVQAVEVGDLVVGEVDLVEVAVFQVEMMEKTVEAVVVVLEGVVRVVGVVVVVGPVTSVVKRDILLGRVHKQGNRTQVSLFKFVIASCKFKLKPPMLWLNHCLIENVADLITFPSF